MTNVYDIPGPTFTFRIRNWMKDGYNYMKPDGCLVTARLQKLLQVVYSNKIWNNSNSHEVFLIFVTIKHRKKYFCLLKIRHLGA